MKITSTSPLTQPAVSQGSRAGQSSEGSTKGSAVDRVSLSPHANFVAEMRDQAGPAEFRQEVVDQVKAQLADGSFEASVDIDSVIDGLMGAL